MKTAISLPDELFRAADRAAKRLGLSRSQLYQRAIAQFLDRQTASHVTEALDAVYGADKNGPPDPSLDELQRASLPREEW